MRTQEEIEYQNKLEIRLQLLEIEASVRRIEKDFIELQAENAQLRAALEILTEPQRLPVCPECYKSVVFDEIQRVWKRSHYDDCIIGAALKLSAQSEG